MAIKFVNSKGRNAQWNIQKPGPMQSPKRLFAAIAGNNAKRTIERFSKQTGFTSIQL